MMTPLDIQTKTFKKAINGYDKNDVDSYLELILADYEKLSLITNVLFLCFRCLHWTKVT